MKKINKKKKETKLADVNQFDECWALVDP